MSDTTQRTNAYPKPPFPEQPQTPPGLASEMQPVPDHGETSYKGHGRLAGKKALITGGDSGLDAQWLSPTPVKGQTSPSTICLKKRKMPPRSST